MVRKILIWAVPAALIVLAAVSYTPDSDPAKLLADYGHDGAPVGKLSLFTREYGDPNGPPLILIHGSNGNALTWEAMIDRLPGYRIITYDQPGHSLTGLHPEYTYRPDQMIEALDKVMAAKGLATAAIAGSSMGGRTAWTFAATYPERISALILISASGTPARPEDTAHQPGLIESLLQTPGFNQVLTYVTPRSIIADTLNRMVVDPSYIDYAHIDLYWRMIRAPGNRQATLDRAAQDRAPFHAPLGKLSNYRGPAALWGRQDAVVPLSAAMSIQEVLPQAKSHILDDIGYLPMEEAPSATAGLIGAFLQSTN